eukprot:6177070-Pleurochrysis_carterae.AAC.1
MQAVVHGPLAEALANSDDNTSSQTHRTWRSTRTRHTIIRVVLFSLHLCHLEHTPPLRHLCTHIDELVRLSETSRCCARKPRIYAHPSFLFGGLPHKEFVVVPLRPTSKPLSPTSRPSYLSLTSG